MRQSPPHDLDAERSLLGSFILDNTKLQELADRIEIEMFHLDAHKLLFGKMMEMAQEGTNIDNVTLRAALDIQETAKTGGVAYVAQIMETVPSAANAEFYLNIVAEKWRLRRIIEVSERLAREAQAGAKGNELTTAMREYAELLDVRGKRDFIPLADLFHAALAESDAAKKDGAGRLRFGWADLDSIATIHKGDLILLAARPSIGKSTFALNFMANMAGRFGFALFSLEVPGAAIGANMLSHLSKISSDRIRRGELSDTEWDKISAAGERGGAMKAWVDDSCGLSVPAMEARLTRLLAKGITIDCVIVDYLGLAKPIGGQTRNEQVSGLSAGMKTMARNFGVPVIALCQLNRAMAREKREPELYDLRDSGSLEQDADMVIFLHREKLTDTRMMVKVAKHRGGRIGVCAMEFVGATLTFNTLPQESREAQPAQPQKSREWIQ